MMCNEVILKSIADHVEAQMYLLSDSVRLSNFTLFLQLIGIFCTLLANLWNASADKTLLSWLKSKGCFDTDTDEVDVETNKEFERSRLSTSWSEPNEDEPEASIGSHSPVIGPASHLKIDATDE